jgi:hypothetical protein
MVNVTATPLVSVAPSCALGVSQAGVLIEYLTVPFDALMRYWKDEGANGPPCAPQADRPIDGVTTKDGEGCFFCGSAKAIDARSTAVTSPAKGHSMKSENLNREGIEQLSFGIQSSYLDRRE